MLKPLKSAKSASNPDWCKLGGAGLGGAGLGGGCLLFFGGKAGLGLSERGDGVVVLLLTLGGACNIANGSHPNGSCSL